MNLIDALTGEMIQFLTTSKSWIIWYITFESYRAYRGVVFPATSYMVRFVITLWLLYFVLGLFKQYKIESDQMIFLIGWFSFIILDKINELMPKIIENYIDNKINKK